MSTAIDQKAYLQKYLTGSSGDKKKKKKKNTKGKGKGFKIIDDDIDLSKLRPLDGDELDILNEGEDAPQIAGIIDERPEELRKLDEFQTSTKWRVINQDDGFNSKLQIQEVKRDIKEVEKENEVIFGKMYSDSEDEKKDSDQSPERKTSKQTNNTETKKKSQHHSDSDFSPPRKRESKNNRNDDSDLSPPRKSTKADKHNNTKRSTNKSDSDASPPRRKEHKCEKSKNKYDSDASPPRKRNKDRNNERSKQNSDSDASPPRKRDSSAKASKSHSKNYDSDLSPPRKQERSKPKEKIRKPSRWGDFNEEKERVRQAQSPDRRKRSHSPQEKRHNNKSSISKNYDSDLSPPRKSRRETPKRRNRTPDSDLSPPRKHNNSPEQRKSNKYKNDRSNVGKSKNYEESRRKSPGRSQNRQRQDSGSDLSPPRKQKRNYDDRRDTRDDDPPPSNKKMEKTLDGKMAGLQDAKQLKHENEAFRRREEEVYKNMTDEMSGRNAKVVSRKGKRETSEDRQKQKEKAERQKVLDEKYKKWSKGLKQIEAQETRMQEFMHEASKPLARYKDDRDLESKLKDIEREGDPMLQYMRGKKREKGELGPEKPMYKGNFPPNRFNIRPGYRWDGVDRSNGYEKKFFEQQSKRKAQEEEAYKWSTEDL